MQSCQNTKSNLFDAIFDANGLKDETSIPLPDGLTLTVNKGLVYLKSEKQIEIAYGIIQIGGLFIDVQQLEALGSDRAGSVFYVEYDNTSYAGITKFDRAITKGDLEILSDYIGGEYSSGILKEISW